MDLIYSKKKGQFYTQKKFIQHFFNKNDTKFYKSLLEPAFGTGVLFIEYISYILKNNKIKSKKEISDLISKSTLVELDKVAFDIGKENILNFLKDIGIKTKPIFLNKSFFDVKINKVDFILMNPPYIRRKYITEDQILSIPDRIKLNIKGNFDMFIFFMEKIRIEINFKQFVSIIPEAYLRTSYSLNNYKYFKKNIEQIFMFKKPTKFDKTSYATIILSIKESKQELEYFIDWKISEKKNLETKKIILNVCNPVATLSNDFYIIEKENIEVDNNLVRYGLWSSGKKKKIFFPYDKNNNYQPVTWDSIKKKHAILYEYLSSKKDLLNQKKSQNKNNLAYGRSQYVNKIDSTKYKYLISSFIKNNKKNKIIKLEVGEVPMSGLVVFETKTKIIETLKKYKLKGTPKNGGYIQISSKNFKRSENGK